MNVLHSCYEENACSAWKSRVYHTRVYNYYLDLRVRAKSGGVLEELMFTHC